MAQQAPAAAGHVPTGAQMRTAVVAASFGNVVEWYDFVVYGLLATVIADHFFTRPTTPAGPVRCC